ncbi:17778_t:CDS:2, partial [Gigaspora rosea]
SIINVLQQLMKNLDKLKQVNEQIYELKESIINTFQRLMKNLNKEKQENEQIRILKQENKHLIQEIQRIKNEMNNNINAYQKQIYILEQENKRLIQEIQRIKNEMNNNINAHQKQIYQMEYARLQFKEVLQNERTRLRTNYQNRFNEYFEYFVQYNNYFQNLTLQLTEEIRRLMAKIEKKDTKLRKRRHFWQIFRNKELDHVVTKIDAAPLHGPISIAQTDWLYEVVLHQFSEFHQHIQTHHIHTHHKSRNKVQGSPYKDILLPYEILGLFYIHQRNVIIGDEIFRKKKMAISTNIINAKLNKNPKYNKIRNYRISLFRSINNNLSQSLLPTPNENHIIILHYGDYSASKMEVLFYHHMLKNQKKNDKKYKTIKEIEESSTKEPTTNNEPFNYHSQKNLDDKIDNEKPQFKSNKKRNTRNRMINYFDESNKTCEFQSLRSTKTKFADLSNCITFRMKELDTLNSSIENIKLQLKELKEKDLKQVLESLREDHCQLKEEWTFIKSWSAKIEKIRKEFFDLYNFYKFGERNRGVRYIN